MKTILIIWGIIFIITFVLAIVYSKKEYKKLVCHEHENKFWRLMGGRSGFYEGALLVSFLFSASLAYLIKITFNL